MGSYSCRNGILNGIHSNSVHIRIKERVRWAATNMTIYGPIGDDTSLKLRSDQSRYSFENAIIYAGNTTKIELFGSGNYRYKGLSLYAYHSKSVYIYCKWYIEPCIEMKIHIHSTSLNIEYPMDRLYIVCIHEFECTDSQLIVSYDNNSTWSCTFTYNKTLTKWFCGNYDISRNTTAPTPSPTTRPTAITNTVNPTILPTYLPSHNPTVIPTKTPINIANTINVKPILTITPKNLPWILLSGTLLFITIIMCVCIGTHIYFRNKAIKTETEHASNISPSSNKSITPQNHSSAALNSLPALPSTPHKNNSNTKNSIIKYQNEGDTQLF